MGRRCPETSQAYTLTRVHGTPRIERPQIFRRRATAGQRCNPRALVSRSVEIGIVFGICVSRRRAHPPLLSSFADRRRPEGCSGDRAVAEPRGAQGPSWVITLGGACVKMCLHTRRTGVAHESWMSRSARKALPGAERFGASLSVGRKPRRRPGAGVVNQPSHGRLRAIPISRPATEGR